MPVRIYPSRQKAEATRQTDVKEDALGMLKKTSKWLQGQKFELYKSSLDEVDPRSRLRATKNGFVDSVLTAYGQHHHLTIRPDDVWIAAISQFSFYVNAHAEELRAQFVKHDGQKDIGISYNIGDRHTLDYGDMALGFADLIQQNVVDPELQEWIMPSFSTSTGHDRIIASMMLMGTMQKFFRYTIMCICGIPSVTLLGEREDYEKLAAKIERFAMYGPEAAQFASLLKPVVKRMALSFDDPAGKATVKFWQQIASHQGGGCPGGEYSGWITAFCFWTEDGECMYWLKDDAIYDELGGKGQKSSHLRGDSIFLELDGVRYHHIGDNSVPPAWCKLPLKLVEADGQQYEAELLAGLSAISITSSGDVDRSGRAGMDTMQPMATWWVYEKREWRDPDEDPEHVWNRVPARYRDDQYMQSMGFRKKASVTASKEPRRRNSYSKPQAFVKPSAADWEFAGKKGARRPR